MWALGNILTAANFGIAMIAALIGYGLVGFFEIDGDLSSYRSPE